MRMMCCALIIALGVSSTAAAAGPITTSGARYAVEAGQAPAPQRTDNGQALIGAGIGMLAGGVTLEILAQTTMKVEEYAYACYAGICSYDYQTHANRPMLFTGLGVALGGALLWQLGANQKRRARQGASLTFSPTGATFRF